MSTGAQAGNNPLGGGTTQAAPTEAAATTQAAIQSTAAAAAVTDINTTRDTQAAATTQTQQGANTPAASNAPAATTTNAAAATTNVAAAQASSSSGASAAASASSSRSVGSSSAAASSSVAAASSSVSHSGQSSLVSMTSSASTSNASGTSLNANATSKSSGLSKGAIGGIAGGAAGGLALLILIWYMWRRRRDKKDWVPPPPPRDMTYNSSHRPRVTSGLPAAGTINRASSYSTLLRPGPSSLPSGSQSPSSYYATYPIATPSSTSHDTSTPLPTSSSSASDSSPPLSGLNTPAQKPVLAPINTTLQRDSSGSSGSSDRGQPAPRHVSSVDRLRQDAQSTFSRSESMSSAHERVPSEGSSRTTSPHPSYGANHRHSFSSSFASATLPSSFPRPQSSYSISSLGPQRVGGAPHQRYVNLQMPRLLSDNGDLSRSPMRPESAYSSQRSDLNDFMIPPTQGRRPSHLSMSAVPPRGYYDGSSDLV